MKKRLEAELISIAHRVLKLKNKSEVDQLFIETQKLYEALSVLKFYGDHIESLQSELPQEELEEKLADSLEGKKTPKLDVEVQQQIAKEKKETVSVDEESEPDSLVEEEPIIVGEINVEDEDEDTEEEPVVAEEEVEEENVHSDPIFEMAAEPVEEVKPETPSKQISFEDFLGDSYKDVEFVKPNDITIPTSPKEEIKEEPKKEIAEVATEIIEDSSIKGEQAEQKKPILNEKLANGINIGLNDRVGFVKYLFDNSSEDFNRVLSQLNTFDSYPDAENFINEMVKPDYNDWKGQEEFSERFMEIVKQKFK